MRGLVLILCLGLPGASFAQESAAARWLAEEAIQAYCGGSGRFEPGGLIEADLTGDGRDDLVIYSGGMTCTGDVVSACGASSCVAELYAREGDLLVPKGTFLTACADLVPGDPPALGFCFREYYVVRWNGTEFAR